MSNEAKPLARRKIDCLNMASCLQLTKSVQFIFLLRIPVNFHEQKCNLFQIFFGVSSSDAVKRLVCVRTVRISRLDRYTARDGSAL